MKKEKLHVESEKEETFFDFVARKTVLALHFNKRKTLRDSTGKIHGHGIRTNAQEAFQRGENCKNSKTIAIKRGQTLIFSADSSALIKRKKRERKVKEKGKDRERFGRNVTTRAGSQSSLGRMYKSK